MSEQVRYLIDTDALVASQRIHYCPNFCESFWHWIHEGYVRSKFFSIDKVQAEIKKGDDSLAEWVKDPVLKGFFLSTGPVAHKWSDIVGWATGKTPAYKSGALTKFLAVDGADAWLVAYAAANPGMVIVTNEVSAPASISSIKLPDAAQAQGVSTISLSQLLSLHAHKNFTFK